MQITSINFLIFTIILFLLYWNINFKYRKYILMLANIIFYCMFGINFFLLLLCEIIFSFIIARYINRNKIILALSIFICLSPLLTFKYFYTSLFPLGLSFYSFQIISYLVDVYKTQHYEKSFIHYFIYTSFFLTISSGPIERYNNISNQLKLDNKFNYENASYGIKLLLWGLFKKIVIADNISFYTNQIFNDVYNYKGFIWVITIFLYSIVIYTDFSGYSDMVKGIAKLFSIDLTTNFKQPYFSLSFKQFWSRWHISLMNFFKEYIYIQLKGSKCSTLCYLRNIFIVYLLSGIWHGSTFNYILWGIYCGILCVIERYIARVKLLSFLNNKYFNFLKMIFVFVAISLSWLFFSTNNLNEIYHIFKSMFIGINDLYIYIISGIYTISDNPIALFRIIIPCILLLIIVDAILIKKDIFKELTKSNNKYKYLLYVSFVLIILLCAYTGDVNFIYFKF